MISTEDPAPGSFTDAREPWINQDAIHPHGSLQCTIPGRELKQLQSKGNILMLDRRQTTTNPHAGIETTHTPNEFA